ncbi:DUF4974 domain-containing protein [Pseudoflavitalea sp. X16]|uniref:FecR family protein n=1 Tax=Paraflavitalea devenefica TaxID=2716334 RepID=UPI0014245D33|nr:FecR family protein [Paraflavitalea devenefica]NII29071.1 DUF4974 domain-containing protein [Paraflavitalea devenefica]
MSIHQLEYLMQLYANRSLSELERKELMQLLEKEGPLTEEALAVLIEQYPATGEVEMPDNWMQAVDRIVAVDRMQNTVEAEIPVIKPARPWKRIGWYAAAACVLALLTGGILYLSRQNRTPEQTVTQTPVTHDALPGTNGAVLTLADGSTVVLDSLGNGIIASQQGATVLLEDGKLQYNPAKAAADAIVYNTMTTPRGRQFRLTLPDGTRVWMNAASSIRFPTQFAGNTRQVELSGEAYFEVAANKQQPFMVQLPGGKSIEVTGTHFNVKAYTDEADTRTTLLEGAVMVKANDQSLNMKPGQQTRITAGGSIALVPGASTQQAIAWMSRSFSFRNDDLETILKQLARWYDIEVKYERGIPKKTFTSNVSMDNNLSDILTVLSQSGVKFSLENGVLRIL